MGRYYDGDIQGKFWFAVQSSDDGEHFGAEEQSSNDIEYYVNRETYMDVGIKTIKDIKKELKIDKKHNHWDLWNEWSSYVDDWQINPANAENPWQYPCYENWLHEQKGIGQGKPKNSPSGTVAHSLYQKHEQAMRPIWELLARLHMGMKMKKFFDDNPDTDELYYSAEC